MKFSYALLRKLLPRLPKAPALAARLNSYSFEVEETSGDLLDVKLPANLYSYASSHVGLAREAAAIFDLPFKHKITRIVNLPAKRGLVAVKVEDKACIRYAARCFDIPKMKATPANIKAVLKTCGINSVNLVVDIMNYAMLETGQPLHAFDAATLAKDKKGTARIFVRKARAGEKLETLDKRLVALDPSVLVIADEKRPLAIAGVKGGLDSGVTAATTRIIVEAANFDGASIYKTGRALNVITDASVRFSHGLSPALVDWGMDRATELLKEAGAKLLDSVDHYPRPAGDEIIDFSPRAYAALVGAPILISDAARTFKFLGFTTTTAMKKSEGILRVRVPAWRNDIQDFEDLVEEAVRLAGYNELEKQAPRVVLGGTEEDDIFKLKDRIRTLLPRLGLDEVYTSSFVGEAELRNPQAMLLQGAGDLPVEMQNPIAEDKKYLRPALAPLLLTSVAENARYYDAVGIFEVGKVFRRRAGAVHETLSLGIALGARKSSKLIRELKEIVSEFLKTEGFPLVELEEQGGTWRVAVNGEPCGELRLVSLEREWVAAVAEINLDVVRKLERAAGRQFASPSKFPATSRDLSFSLPPNEQVGKVTAAAAAVGGKMIEEMYLVGEPYIDEKLGGRSSHTLHLVFRDPSRTLTDEEVNKLMQEIAAVITREHNAEIR